MQSLQNVQDALSNVLITVGSFYQGFKNQSAKHICCLEMFVGEIEGCKKFLKDYGNYLGEEELNCLARQIEGSTEGLEASLEYVVKCIGIGESWLGTKEGIPATRLFNAISTYNLIKRTSDGVIASRVETSLPSL